MLANDPADAEKKQAPPRSLRGRGHRVRILFALIDLFFAAYFLGERLLGAGIVRLAAAPFIAVDLGRRRHDFAHFKTLRAVLPEKFWKGVSPRAHYYHMVRDWYEGGGVALLYSRLATPYWKKRFTVRGPLPQQHPDWGKRPVIFTFLHTGPFGVLLMWLRAQGMATASLVGGLPLMLENQAFAQRAEAADRIHGVADVPPIFQRGTTLRDVYRFLQPGHCLLIALDGGKRRDEVEQCQVEGWALQVRNGAIRLGARTNALVIPIAIHRSAMCRFEIHFGTPVPDELLQQKENVPALQHLINQLWPQIQQNPNDLNWTTLEALSPELRKPRIGWP